MAIVKVKYSEAFKEFAVARKGASVEDIVSMNNMFSRMRNMSAAWQSFLDSGKTQPEKDAAIVDLRSRDLVLSEFAEKHMMARIERKQKKED